MKYNRKLIKDLTEIFLLIVCLSFIILLISGARFTSRQAARIGNMIDKSSVLLGVVDSHPYKIYIYENSDKYRTIETEYRFPFWWSNCSFYNNKTEDKVKLVGWCSYGDNENKKAITVVPVQSFDDRVAYIVMGSGTDLQRKAVKTGEVLLFYWKKNVRWNDLNAVAYSSNNKKLYKLGYEIVNSTIHADKLRWLPADE